MGNQGSPSTSHFHHQEMTIHTTACRDTTGSSGYYTGVEDRKVASTMNQSLTEDMLLALTGTTDNLEDPSPSAAATHPRLRRHKCGPSTSSDVVISTFDVVEKSAIPGGGETPFCGGCNQPIDSIAPLFICR